LNWTIQQLNIFNTSISTHSDITINSINSCISSVNKLIKIIKHDFSYNFQEAKNIVSQLEKSIEPLYNSFLLTKTLKNYARNLIFFSNKYRHENEKIKDSISHCEQLYQENKYKEVLDKLIPVLDNIKKSAKINNVKFS
jgi:septation ring formation regulator EzrA